jgi:hypothetical protein
MYGIDLKVNTCGPANLTAVGGDRVSPMTKCAKCPFSERSMRPEETLQPVTQARLQQGTQVGHIHADVIAEHLGKAGRRYAPFFIAASNCQATTALTAWT